MKAFYEMRNEPHFIGLMTEYPFPMHVHEIVETVLILEGGCTIHLDSRIYNLRAGDAAIFFPMTPHSFDVIEPGCRGFAAFFPADTIPEYATTFRTLVPDEPVVRDARSIGDIAFATERMLAVSREGDDASPMRLAYLHLYLAHLLGAMSYHAAGELRERDLGARIIRYVYDHACENISLSSTARDLGISESHLSHLFAQQFKVNFRRFINAIRIEKAAKLMLDPGLTLTQISDQCGFENTRTFRRAFVRETGSLPTAYMRSTRTGNR